MTGAFFLKDRELNQVLPSQVLLISGQAYKISTKTILHLEMQNLNSKDRSASCSFSVQTLCSFTQYHSLLTTNVRLEFLSNSQVVCSHGRGQKEDRMMGGGAMK